MYGWYQGYDHGYHGIGMFLAMLLFWLPLIGLAAWLVARLTRGANRSAAPAVLDAPADSARGILDRRLASGELTVEQYTEMRQALESGSQK